VPQIEGQCFGPSGPVTPRPEGIERFLPVLLLIARGPLSLSEHILLMCSPMEVALVCPTPNLTLMS
jgi:hypothetical protein